MEIGSIFDINIKELFKEGTNEFFLPFMKNTNYQYHYFFNTGRSAIEYLLRKLSSKYRNKKILLPSFNCSSVIDAVKRAGIDYELYSITEDLQININDLKEKVTDNVKFIYIIHYFGNYQSDESFNLLMDLKKNNILLIEDLSHALYSSHPKYIGFGNYILGSIRKWLPIPDGAFLSSRKPISMKSIESGYNEYAFNYFAAQVMKNAYLQDNTLDKEHYLKLISRANKSLFSDYTIRSITELSKNYILNYNMTELIERRVNNYKYLLNNIKKYSFLKPVPLSKEGVVPFGMVILSEYRDELLKFLIENNVYCNIHWNIPDECKNADVISKNISELILTIPCDQRYSQEEMDYIIKTLDSFRI